MTIKNTDKNVSAENHEDVVVNASFNNGILTLIRKNLYDESTSAQKNIEVDLSDHKLKLKVLGNETELRTLEESDDEDDIKEKQSYIFLVPFENSGEEGVYREYIWVEDEHDANGGEFEVIGSTKTDLEPYLTTELAASTYVAKEAGKGLSSNDYTTAEKNKLANLATVATSGSYNDLTNKPTIPDISGKEDVSNKVTTISSSSTNNEYPTALTVYNALQNVGGGGLDPQEISDAAEAIGEYNNPNDGDLQNPQTNLLLCVKLPIMSDYNYEYFNIRINGDNSGFYWYPSKNNNHFKEYLFADNFVGNERNYSIYLVDPDNNPETDTRFLIGTIDLDENTYTVNENTYDIGTKTILIDLSTLNLSGQGGNGGGIAL